MRRVIAIAAGVLLVIGVFVVLFALRHESVEAPPYRVAAIMRIEEDNIYWRRVWNGVRDEASALGMEISEYQYDADPLVGDYLEICYYSGVDAVIIGVRDPAVLEESGDLVEQMRREGIVIAAVDVDIGDTWSDVYIGLDNYSLGRQMVQQASAFHGQADRIALVITEDTSNTHVMRLEGCMDQLEEYDLMDETDVLELSGEYIEQMYALQDYLVELDAPALLIIINPRRTVEIASFVSRNRMAEPVMMIGLGESEEALNYIGDGTVQALMMQDNYGMGVSAVRAVYEYFEDPSALDPWVTVDTVVVTEENWADVLPEVLETPN